jgi:two-component system heavy metal sensor histidine kinase CusS
MKNNSIRFKIGVLYTTILGVILIFFSIYPIYITQNILRKEQEDALLVKARQLDDYIEVYTITSQKDQTSAMLLYMLFKGEILNNRKLVAELWERNTKSLGLGKDLYRIRNIKGEEVLRSNNFTPDTQRNFDIKFAGFGDKKRFVSMRINGIPYYGINYQIIFAQKITLNLQLEMPITYAQKIINDMVFSYICGILFVLFAGLFIATYLTRRILKPVDDVTRTARDITQKNLNLRISVEEYDKEFKELVDSFNQMIGRLGSSFAYINDFNSHVSHEMKTPLAIIKGELELALEAGNTKEKNEQVMKNVLEEVYRLIRIIKEMLLIAEYEYKFEIFNMEKMDLVKFLNEVFQQTRVLVEEKNINFEFLMPNESFWIKGDATHLRRVFFNLIHNAVKFTPIGGEIKILTEVSDKQVFVSIKDTGIGIASENQARIFKKFYRVRSSVQGAIEGNGLGLSMARAITKAHKGDITFESDVNKGSTFKVSLPILPH